MDIEAYKVAVKLQLSENISAGLLAVSRHFANTEQSAVKLRNELTNIGKMAAVGGGFLAVGLTISKGLDAALKSAREVAKAQADFKTLNLSTAEMAEVNATAATLSHKVLGSTIAGNIKTVQDLHTAFGDLHHALATAPAFTKYETSVKMALGERAADGMVNAAAKALEHRGGNVINDPKEFQRELNMMAQVQFATKNRVSPRDFLQASQTGKMAYAFMSPEYLYGKFAGLMSMSSGDKVGTAAMTYFSSIIGGHMDKKAKGFLSNLGLYEEGVSKARLSQMQKAMHGMTPTEKRLYLQSVGGESLLSGGLKSQYVKMATERPDEFADLLVSRIKTVYGKNITDDQALEIAKNFNRNTGDYLGQLIRNKTKLEKDSRVFRKAMDYNQAYDNYLNSPDGAGMALASAWTNLKATIGLQLLPMVTKATLGLAKFIDKISDIAEKNPQLAKFGTYAVAAAAGITTISGGILMLGATIAAARLVSSLGVVSSIVTMLGGPLVWAGVAAAGAGYLIYKNWDQIKPAMHRMGNEFKGIANDIWDRVKQVGVYVSNWSLWTHLEDGFSRFSTALTTGFNNVYDYIIGLLNKVPGVSIPDSKHLGGPAIPTGPLPSTSPSPVLPPKGTYGGDYANAMLGNNGGNGMSYAQGMRQTSSALVAPPVVSGSGQPVQINTTVNMDGKKVGEYSAKYLIRGATRAPSSTSAADPTMSLIYPGIPSSTFTQ